jgi:hypothetical protein
MYRALVYALILAVAVVLAAACGGSDEPDAVPAGDSSDDPGLHDVEPGSAPIPSMNLAGDYFRQEEAANDKYKGQVVDIEGLVTEVGVTAEDIPYVGMTGMQWLLVQCIFPEDWTAGLPDLPKAESAVLRGKVEGLMENVRVGERQFIDSAGVRLTLSDCSVVE